MNIVQGPCDYPGSRELLKIGHYIIEADIGRPPESSKSSAAGDSDSLPIYPAPIFTAQEGNHTSDVFGYRNALQGARVGHALRELVSRTCMDIASNVWLTSSISLLFIESELGM